MLLFFEDLLIHFCSGVCSIKVTQGDKGGGNVLLLLLVDINIVAICEPGSVSEVVIDSHMVNVLILKSKFGF